MTWSNIKFTANEVIRICIQVVLGGRVHYDDESRHQNDRRRPG